MLHKLLCLTALAIASVHPLANAEPSSPGGGHRAIDLLEEVEHGYADHDGVRIHYVSSGEGPLIVLLHGFPDFWYTWREVMEELRSDFHVVALDLRGYNKSDKPEGVQNYVMPLLVGDVEAVIRDVGAEDATIVGHDWGAGIAWQFAMSRPLMTNKLVILSVPHPSGFSREMSTNEDQKRDSQYARDFQKEGAHESLTAEGLAGWVADPAAKKLYVEAFARSDFEAMLNYYKASYPKSPSRAGSASAPAAAAAKPSWPRIKCSVLIIHGMKDRALHHRGHAYAWEWIDGDTTLLMIPTAGHFVQQDAPELVSSTIHDWLLR